MKKIKRKDYFKKMNLLKDKEADERIVDEGMTSKGTDKKKHRRAFKYASEIRRFEIDLYWKRSAYFWVFIGIIFAAYYYVINSSPEGEQGDMFLELLVICTGFIFSLAWFFVNKGSKYWQENYENHVELLEDEILGNIHKVITERPKPRGTCELIEEYINGPASFSVSKINQIVSFYIVVVWVLLFAKYVFDFIELCNRDAKIIICTLVWAFLVLLFVSFVWFLYRAGRTYRGNHNPVAYFRGTKLAKHDD
ncbi:MAG: hypothetical protein ACR2PR_06710 [Pseudohongiellaceae bacterium]